MIITGDHLNRLLYLSCKEVREPVSVSGVSLDVLVLLDLIKMSIQVGQKILGGIWYAKEYLLQLILRFQCYKLRNKVIKVFSVR